MTPGQTSDRLPPSVILCATEFRVTEREGTVIFTEAWPVCGCGTRLVFQREIDGGGWYLSLSGDSERASATRVVEAYRHLIAVHGDGFGSHSIRHRP